MINFSLFSSGSPKVQRHCTGPLAPRAPVTVPQAVPMCFVGAIQRWKRWKMESGSFYHCKAQASHAAVPKLPLCGIQGMLINPMWESDDVKK